MSDHTLADNQVFDRGHTLVSDRGHNLVSAGVGNPVSDLGTLGYGQEFVEGTQVTVLENEVFGIQVSDQVEDNQVSGQGRQEYVQVSAVDTQVSLL